MSDLQRLSDEATPGPWVAHDDRDAGDKSAWFVVCGADPTTGIGSDICWMEMSHDAANSQLIVALVNAFREGRLIERQTCSHGNSPHCYPYCVDPDPRDAPAGGGDSHEQQ